MAPDIAAGGGAAEVATKDFGAIAGLYEANNANALRASEATAANATHASIAGAQIANQSSMEADRLGEQRRQFDQSRGVSERDNWMANVQAHAAQQHAQLQAWVQGQELSQSEQMELQRNQNSIGTINGMRSRGEITDETADAMLGQVIPRINAANARHQMALAKQEEANAKKANEAVVTEQAHRQTQQEFAARYVKNGAMYTDDNDNIIPPDQVDSFQGAKHLHLQNQHGVFTRTNPKTGKESPEVDDTGVTYEKHQAMRAKAVAAANAFIANAEKPGPDGNAPPKGTPEDRIEMQKKFMDEMYGRQLDWKPASRGAPQGGPGNTPPATNQPGAAPQAGPPTAQQAAPQAPPPPPTEGELKAMQPFDRMKPETMAPAQKQMMAGYSEMHGEIRLRRDLPEKQRWAAEDAMTDIMAMVERYGSVQRLPPAEKAKYDRAKAIVSKLPPDPYASTGNANAGLGVGGY